MFKRMGTIDRETTLEAIELIGKAFGDNDALDRLKELVRYMPNAERCGSWLFNVISTEKACCSECEYMVKVDDWEDGLPNYCPRCGTRLYE